MMTQRLPNRPSSPAQRLLGAITRWGAFLCLPMSIPVTARAQLIGYNWVFGQNSIAPDYYGVSGIVSTSVMRGSGLTAPAYSGEIFTSTGYAAGSNLATAIADNDYIGITITNTAPSTQTVDITGIYFDYESTNGGPTLLCVESSTYGFTTNGLLTEMYSTSTPQNVFIASNFGILNAASPSVEIRLYGVEPSSSSGIFALTGDQYGPFGVYGSVNSAAASAPEPNPAVIFCLGAPLVLIAWWKRPLQASRGSLPTAISLIRRIRCNR